VIISIFSFSTASTQHSTLEVELEVRSWVSFTGTW